MARRSRPEDLACARLDGISHRHATREPIDVDTAVAELLAVEAVTPDKLAESAGLALGFYRNEMDYDSHVMAALLLVRAGADLTLVSDWMREGARRRAIRPLTAR